MSFLKKSVQINLPKQETNTANKEPNIHTFKCTKCGLQFINRSGTCRRCHTSVNVIIIHYRAETILSPCDTFCTILEEHFVHTISCPGKKYTSAAQV